MAVARNLAHIVILLYALWLLSVSHHVLMRLLRPKLSRKDLHYLNRGLGNRYLLLSAKNHLSPVLFWWNAAAILLFCFTAVLTVLLGWFGFIDSFMRVVNSVMILAVATETAALSLVSNQLRFGETFVLYRPIPDEARLFASSILDAVLYVAIPVFVVVCNATDIIPRA